MQDIRLPLVDNLFDPLRQDRNFAPFAYRGWSLNLGQCSEELQTIKFFKRLLRYITMLVLPDTGDTGHGQAAGNLRFHDRPGAKAIAAVQRQAVIQYVQYPRHGEKPCQKRINVPSTQ